MAKLLHKWMLLPAILFIAMVAFYLMHPDWQKASQVPVDFASIVTDKKLKETLRAGLEKGQQPGVSSGAISEHLKIEMFIKKDQLAALAISDNVDSFRKHRKDFIIRINGGHYLVANYKIRGKGSTYVAYEQPPVRLNYTVTLFHPVELKPGIQLAKFYLMNMLFDPYHVNMALSYRLLSGMNLFFSHTQYAALSINGVPQGVYLLIEPHKDAIRRTYPGVMGIYRRRMKRFCTKYEKGQSIDQWHLRQLERVMSRARGPDLPVALNKILNLDAYLTWMAFNSVMQNADSVDELFYVAVASKAYPEGRIEFMAWDCDDIFKSAPSHPTQVFDDPLMFGCENELDRLIQQQPSLYHRYKRILHQLITHTLTPSNFRSHLDSVRNDAERFEQDLIDADRRSVKSERDAYVEQIFDMFTTRRRLLLNRLSEDG